MNYQPLIWFAIGRLIYSLIDRRSWKFNVVEVLSVGTYLIFGWYLLDIDAPATKGLLIAGTFLLTAVASRLVVKRHPVEAADPGKKPIAIGIIDFAWFSILAGTLGILVFARSSHPITDVSPAGPLPKEFIQAEMLNTMFLLGKTIDSVFLLGGVLAGCMAILWAGEIWRKSDGKSHQQYRFTTVSAIRMVVAYFVAIMNALYWVGIPLYTRLNNLSALLKQ
ncbi:hypothetical protein ACFL6I_08605 [candidate division KSB1 bacterium]